MTQILPAEVKRTLNIPDVPDMLVSNVVAAARTYVDSLESEIRTQKIDKLKQLIQECIADLNEFNGDIDEISSYFNKHIDLNSYRLSNSIKNISNILQNLRSPKPTNLREIAEWVRDDRFLSSNIPFYVKAGFKFDGMSCILVVLNQLGFLSDHEYCIANANMNEVSIALAQRRN